ncbi:MAG: tRNA uridine-5-carboxymethylaminomethyl(34) synthesis enzyme MnmG [Bacteroidales bacterium]|nr:tRNA uridine-5-carboxymethylaminomethyl(34) synthesis enzyme MnmG [Bacteroidales bacterium]
MRWESFDIVVVGGGHAGAEATMAAARLGMKTLLITQSLDAICRMSCNPAMGGVAKGQIVREIDALGGFSGIVADQTTLQFRMLNRSKGPAMWSPRAQCDKDQFSNTWRRLLEQTPNVSLWQDEVVSLLMEGSRAAGVRTRLGVEVPARAVVLTNGTFLRGLIHVGDNSWSGGRLSESAADGLSQQLLEMGFEVERLKTGTPMRVDGRSIRFDKLQEQPGDTDPQKFSFLDATHPVTSQMPCYMAYTSHATHEILRTGFDRSPLYTGRIQGRGPRYCPSIEDKIVRFADKDRHQIFVEPEGRNTNSYYLNGFSSSLPLEVQLEALHSMVGFEEARILKPGYAIEYDYFPPTQLRYTLETLRVENLYFAGQINGTTGYEEAACQGLMAGANAAFKLLGREPFVLTRTQAYIGVLIDDLVSKGVDEPYRMFTSRAEYRTLLRQDNADERLTPLAFERGLVSSERMERVAAKREAVQQLISAVEKASVTPEEADEMLAQKESAPLTQRTRLVNLLLRPEVSLGDLRAISEPLEDAVQLLPEALRDEVCESAEIAVKYQRYIEKEQEVAGRIMKFENLKLPSDMDYFSLTALSYESREKMSRLRPQTIGQASRISGVSPADISVLIVYMNHRTES